MIYVVGTSFSSLAATNAFVKKGLEVTVLDIGKKSTFNSKQKIIDLIKKGDIYKAINFINNISKKNAKNYPKIKMNKTNFGSHFYREKLMSKTYISSNLITILLTLNDFNWSTNYSPFVSSYFHRACLIVSTSIFM